MRTPRQAGEGQQYALTSVEDAADFWGPVHEAEGLFTPLPGDEGARRVRLVGCLPQGGLLKSVGHIGGRRALAGRAGLELLDADGETMGCYVVEDVTVVGLEPSSRGAGLVDLTVTLWCDNALPDAGAVWDLLRSGRLNREGLWRALGPEARWAWLSVALWSREYRHRGRPDHPPGRTITLDGRRIADRNSFFCAIGEAVNGPGGYFGWNLDALADCLRGRWGAATPFTLHWDFSDETRARLAERSPAEGGGPALFDVIVDILEEGGVEVVLR